MRNSAPSVLTQEGNAEGHNSSQPRTQGAKRHDRNKSSSSRGSSLVAPTSRDGQRRRSLRPSRTAAGHITFPALHPIRVWRSDVAQSPKEAASPSEKPFRAEAAGLDATLIVGHDTTPAAAAHFQCATNAAASDAALVFNALNHLRQSLEPGSSLALLTAAAPDARDGDRVDHVTNVLRKITDAIAAPQILTVREESGTGLHGHYVFPVPAARLAAVHRIAAHQTVLRHDTIADGELHSAVHVSRVSDVMGLGAYLIKEVRDGKPLRVGWQRVDVNDNLGRELMATGLYEPQRRKRPHRGLPRAADERSRN